MLGANLAGATLDYPRAYEVSDWDPGPSSSDFGRVNFAGVNLHGATLPTKCLRPASSPPSPLKSANVLNAANRKDASCAAASGAAAFREACNEKARFVGASPQKL